MPSGGIWHYKEKERGRKKDFFLPFNAQARTPSSSILLLLDLLNIHHIASRTNSSARLLRLEGIPPSSCSSVVVRRARR